MQSELLSEYNELTTTIRSLREQAKEKAKTILREGLASYFEKHGRLVRCIAWRQYTPYFNDGESCEFSVHEPVAILWPVVETEEDDEDDYNEDSKYAYYAEDFDAQKITERIEIITEYEADPLGWSKARVAERNAAIQGSYRYPDNFYVTYPPDNYTLDELKLMLIRATLVDDSFKSDTDAVLNFISSIDEDIMKELFGDHVQVIISANDTIVEDYNHD